MSSSTEREKVGFDLRVNLGQLETVSEGALAGVVGSLVSSVIAAVLLEPGVELDTLNVLVTPESTDEAELLTAAALDRAPIPDVLHVRAWALRDRPTE